MTSVDFGILFALNGGFEIPTAAGAAAVPGSAVASGLIPATDEAQAEGPESFMAALRAASAGSGQGAADLTAGFLTEAVPPPANGQPISTAAPLEADDALVELPSDGASVQSGTLAFLEALGMTWGGGIRAEAPAEVCASIPAVPLTAAAANAEAGETEAPDGSALRSWLVSTPAAGSLKENGRSGAAADQVETAARIIGRKTEISDLQDSGHMPQPLPATVSAAKTEMAPGERHAVRPDAAEETQAVPGPVPPATEKAAVPVAENRFEPVEPLSAGQHARVSQRANEASQSASRQQPAAGTLAGPSRPTADVLPATGSADATVVHTPTLQAAHPQEDGNGRSSPEPSRGTETAIDRGEAGSEQRSATAKDPGEFRHFAEDLLSPKMADVGKKPSLESEAFPEALATPSRDTHAHASAERGIEKAADGSTAVRDREMVGATGRGGVFDQIVQRAAVHLKEDYGEIHIDLKPDFLGRVRMQITTENQQLAVRIITELPNVRDMIDAGLSQLKSELQSQGLQVERLEVTVANDHRQRDWQQAHTAHGWKAVTNSEDSTADLPPAEQRFDPVYRWPRSAAGPPSIDMFV